jgi:uncharacterized DUF497 family protein
LESIILKTKKIEWSEQKNQELKETRNVCFEAVENAIYEDKILNIVPHHNPEKYPNQKILLVEINGYIHYVPFVEDQHHYFLKSIIPSRKYHKQST